MNSVTTLMTSHNLEGLFRSAGGSDGGIVYCKPNAHELIIMVHHLRNGGENLADLPYLPEFRSADHAIEELTPFIVELAEGGVTHVMVRSSVWDRIVVAWG